MAEKKKYVPAIPAGDKKKALETALSQIEKSHGRGSIMRMGDRQVVNVDAISTGSLSLDFALGIGGVPKGRIIEIYGPESSGKTTLALHIIAQAQQSGGDAAFIDVEHALEPAYARAVGVDIDNLLISQPDMGDDALAITEVLVRSGAVDVVVVDSVAALVPRSEVEGEIGDASVGVVARLMSQALRKLAGSISKTNCVVIFINQLREKIGVVYGNPETTPGGRALKYFSSVRIEVRRAEFIKNGSEHIGNRTRAKIVKNKVAPPFREGEFDIMFGEGISRYGELIDLGARLELIEKSGAWYTVEGMRFQGRDNVKDYLKENPDIADKLEAEIRRDSLKLMSPQEKAAAKAAGRAIDVEADDFEGSKMKDGHDYITIESIQKSEKSNKKLLVLFNDGSKLSVSPSSIADFNLYSGRDLTYSEYTQLKSDIDYSASKTRALRILGNRSLSTGELKKRLINKGDDENIAEQTVTWLNEIGILDDKQYALSIVKHYSTNGYGMSRIKDELYKRGIPREIWDEVLSELDESDADDATESYLRKKLKGSSDDSDIRRAANALIRRGFSYDQVNIAVNKYKESVTI